MGEMTITRVLDAPRELVDLDGKTELVAHQAGNMPDEQYKALVDGYGGFFHRLAEHLAQG